MIVTGISLFAGFALNEVFENQRFKEGLIDQAFMNARLVSEYCVTPLDFGYQEEAQTILSKLASIPDVQNGFLFNNNGGVFASYHRDMPVHVRTFPTDTTHHFFDDEGLHIFSPITFNGALKGSIYLRVSTSTLSERQKNRLFSVFVIGVGMLIISYFLGQRMQKVVSHPILTLAELTRKISESGDYSIQINKSGKDEISVLYAGFSNMLEQIHLRENERDIAEEEKTRLNAILENTSDLVSMADPAGNLTYMNPAGLKILGWTELDSLSNLKIPDVHPGWANDVITEEGIPAAITEGVWQGETALLDKDGNEVPLLQVLMSHKSGVGELLYMSTIMRDITDRKLAEEQAEKSAALLKAIFDAIPDGIIATSREHEILSVNAGFLRKFNFDEEQVLGQNTADLVEDRKEYAQIQEERNDLPIEEQLKPHIIHYKTSDGNVFPGETLSVPIYTQAHENTGHIKLIRDISDRVHFEASLRQSQKLESIGTMVGGISHELNNILQSMFLYGGLLQDDLPENEEMQELLQHMLDDGERARDIVQQILTFSREGVSALVPQHIHGIIDEALSFLATSLPPNIRMIKQIDSDCDRVLCDKTQIHQIIINLCNNARDAMQQKGGVLDVRLQQKPDSGIIELVVRDSGQGMKQELQERIFDPFFTTKEIGEGTGLGLSVIHGIVELMEGEISVESEPGKGSTFNLRFPAAQELPEAMGNPDPKITFDANKHILIVDDEESIRMGAHTNFERQGFKVTSAQHGVDALGLFMRDPDAFDLVMTDLSMPEMSGVDLARAIRDTGSIIPIVLSTGQLGIDSENEYRDVGVTAFIQKPWTNQDLNNIVKGLLST